MIIKTLTEKEFDSLQTLLEEAYSISCQSETFFSQLTEQDISLIAVADDVVVGHILLCYRHDVVRNYGYYELQYVCVREAYRRHGIATKLLLKCEELARQNGLHHIMFTSGNQRVAAHACYLKNGYRIRDSAIFIKEIFIEK